VVSNLDDHGYVLYCLLSNGSCFPLTIAVLIGKNVQLAYLVAGGMWHKLLAMVISITYVS
jgi:hypothetical protein